MHFNFKLFLGLLFLMTGIVFSDTCVDCHKKKQPNIVIDWELSKHSQVDVDCATCHGEEHQTDSDFATASGFKL